MEAAIGSKLQSKKLRSSDAVVPPESTAKMIRSSEAQFVGNRFDAIALRQKLAGCVHALFVQPIMGRFAEHLAKFPLQLPQAESGIPRQQVRLISRQFS